MSYHDRIINLVVTKAAPDIWRESTNEIESALCNGFREADIETAYAIGHRDARHAAAEIATEADTVIADLLDALEDAMRWFGKLKDWSGVGDPDIDKYRAAIKKARDEK